MQTTSRLKCFFSQSIILPYNGEVIKSHNTTQFCNLLWVTLFYIFPRSTPTLFLEGAGPMSGCPSKPAC